MDSFANELQQRLLAIREQGLWRELRRVDSPQGARIEIAGRALLNFSSNDYLGLANHPALKEAAVRAVEKFGTGTGASRPLLERFIATANNRCDASVSASIWR